MNAQLLLPSVPEYMHTNHGSHRCTRCEAYPLQTRFFPARDRLRHQSFYRHNAEEIRKNADSLIEEHQIKCVIFDFADTNFMDSSGIGVIMGRYRLVYLLGGEVWVVHANERMKKILTMSGVTRIIQIYEEEKV